MSWSEDAIHRALARARKPRGVTGSVGHDAAVLERLRGAPVVCVDACIEGVHFEPRTPPRIAGRKACLRALSDLAATAARPRAVLLALTADEARTNAWVRAVVAGVREAAREHGADLVGGDLSCAPGPAALAVTALGEYRARGAPPGRDRARVGQRVVVTGPTGGSLLGRHLRIAPRIAEGIALHALGATALMDVSDGLAWDLFRLARASAVRIELDVGAIPIHRDAVRRSRTSGRTALDHALHDGEDHELVATLGPRAAARTHAAEIGRVVRGRGLVLVDGARRTAWGPEQGGWRHGG